MSEVLRPDEDWQSRRTVIETNRYMWIHKVACDVTFIVGPEGRRIGAHKYILGSRSQVFYAMFFGLLSGNTGSEIVLPDMTPEQFSDLMLYLYTENLDVTLDNVLQTLYAAKKYGVGGLIDKCLNRLKQHMVPENVCTIMENAHVFGDSDLQEKCISLIKSAPQNVLEAADLSALCQECLAMIIKDDTISVTEDVIFEAVLRYAREKCDQMNLEQTKDNLREMVKDVIPHIRFPLMSNEFFSEKVEPSGVLTEQEVIPLFKHLLLKRPGDVLGFSAKKRKMVFTAQRFMETASGWGYKRDKCDAVTFSTSVDIVLRGIQIYGSSQGPSTLDAIIHVKQEPYRANVIIQRFEVETDGKQKIYSIFFTNPPILKKQKKYTITLVINGPTTYHGVKGLKELVHNDLQITFERSELSTNNTSEERGQIPGIIYELAPESAQLNAMD